MMFDAHVHMGYYERRGSCEPWYYSPRRVLGVLDRCGVEEFIVSSTCAQVEGIRIADLNREAREMKRLAGRRAHVFLWVSGQVLDEDPQLKVLDERCGRLMFGTDLPVWQSMEACGLTERYRANVAAWERMGHDCDAAFRAFLGGAGGSRSPANGVRFG